MTPETTLELFARAADAFNRRDLDAWLAVCDPEIEFADFLMEMEGGGSFHGHEGVRRWWANYYDTFTDVDQELVEVRELGDDVVLAHGRTRGRVRGGIKSPAPFEQAFWLVVKTRGDKAVWWRSFRTEAEALAAAGQAK